MTHLRTLAAALFLVSVCCVSCVGATDVLTWLGALPFGGATAAAAAAGHGVTAAALRVGDVVTPAPLPAGSPPPVAGSVLSDTFVSSPIRRGLFITRDAANNTEVARVPFESMFNYSAPLAPGVPLPAEFTEMVLTAVHTGAVLDSQALLALRLLLQYQQTHEWKKDPAANADKLHWDAFLAQLPRPASVCFYTQAELAELQIPIESPVFSARGQQLDTIQESFMAFEDLIKQKPEYGALFPSGFTERWYRWAYGTVLNTAVEIPIRDEEGEMGAMLAMIPLIDQVNHANPPYANAHLRWNYDAAAEAAHLAAAAALPLGPDGKKPAISHGSGSISIVASRDLKAGEELFITYGSITAIPLLRHAKGAHGKNDTHSHSESIEGQTARDKHHNDTSESHFTAESFFPQIGLSNSQLLVHYGVALPSNEHERVALDIGLDEETVGVQEHHYDVVELKRQIIDLNELDHGTLIGLDGRLDPFFIQALRTKHLTQEDLAHLAVNEYEFSPEHGYLSLQNELKWQLQLVVSIESLLTAYPTTLQADLENLRDHLAREGRAAHANGNLVHALAYRIALKRVLHSLVLRSLESIQDLFLNISTQWSEQLHKHNLEEEAELKLHLDLTPERKAELLAEWAEEQKTWFTAMEEWKAEMDKWGGVWSQWVQTALGARGLLEQLPHHNLHAHATPDSLDEMLDPSIHPLQLHHDEPDIDAADAKGMDQHDGDVPDELAANRADEENEIEDDEEMARLQAEINAEEHDEL